MADKSLVSIKYIRRAYLPQALRTEVRTHRELGSPAAERVWKEQDFVNFLGRPKTRGYVVEEGDLNLAGVLLVDYSTRGELVIVRLTVDPDFRRNGFGTVLLEKAVEVADQLGFPPVAYVYEQDVNALAFFKAAGWRSAVEKDHFGNGQDAIRFYPGE